MNLDVKNKMSLVQDVLNPCPLCLGFQDTTLSKTGFPGHTKLRNVICRKCGLIRISPRMSDQGYINFYKNDFFNYLDPYNRPAYVEEIERTTDDNFVTPTKKFLIPFLIDHVCENGDVLDVGAGFGQTLYLLKKYKNINPVGLEPDPFSREISEKRIGIKLLDRTIEKFTQENRMTFDFIILNQTFEHLLEPLESLDNLSKMLNPEGVIYIGVPNAYNPYISMDLFYQVAHTFNYTPHTLNLFAKRTGLKIIKIRDPKGYPLEVLMAPSSSKYSEVDKKELEYGSSWIKVALILIRKRVLNKVRGFAKTTLKKLVSDRAFEKIKNSIDRLIRYKY